MAFPTSKWMASHRKLEDIVISHFNIKKWGHDERYVLKSFRESLPLYELLSEQRRLFVIDINRPSTFNLQAFAAFLGCALTDNALSLVHNWVPINDLAYQKQKHGEAFVGEKEIPPGLSDLRDRHPWITEAEARYQRLVDISNCW
jgi:hypothetical protein